MKLRKPMKEFNAKNFPKYYFKHTQKLNSILQSADPFVLKVCKKIDPGFGKPGASLNYVLQRINHIALILEYADKVREEELKNNSFSDVWK